MNDQLKNNIHHGITDRALAGTCTRSIEGQCFPGPGFPWQAAIQDLGVKRSSIALPSLIQLTLDDGELAVHERRTSKQTVDQEPGRNPHEAVQQPEHS